MLKQVDALGNCWIFNMIQESCGRHDVGHWGMKALFSIFFKFGLEIALGLLLLLASVAAHLPSVVRSHDSFLFLRYGGHHLRCQRLR